MLNEPLKIHHKQSLKRKKPVLEQKNEKNLDNIFKNKKHVDCIQ